MKEYVVIFLSVTFCASMLFFSLPVWADDDDYEGGFSGTYYYITTEVTVDDPIDDCIIRHCSGSGTITFSPDGKASVNGINRCGACKKDIETIENIDNPFTYVLWPDGTLLLTEDGTGSKTNCRILDGGRIVLCDGTASEDPELWSFSSVAVRLSNGSDDDD